jgi:putative transposase
MKMSNIINDPVLISSIQDLARGIKSEADLSSLTRELLKITVEASLNGEMEAHLGYPKHSPTARLSHKKTARNCSTIHPP